jgi:chromosome segregation protein
VAVSSERQNLLWLLKRNEARAERTRLSDELADATRRIEADSTRLQELEGQLETARDAQLRGQRRCSAGPGGAVHAVSSELTRLEGELARLRDSRRVLESRLAQLERDDAQWRSQQENLAADRRTLAGPARPCRAACRTVRGAPCRGERTPARSRRSLAHAADAAAAAVRRELNQAEQQIRVEDAHRVSSERTLDTLAQRRARLAAGSKPPYRRRICAMAGRAGGGAFRAADDSAGPASGRYFRCPGAIARRPAGPQAGAGSRAPGPAPRHRAACAARGAGPVAEQGAGAGAARRLAQTPSTSTGSSPCGSASAWKPAGSWRSRRCCANASPPCRPMDGRVALAALGDKVPGAFAFLLADALRRGRRCLPGAGRPAAAGCRTGRRRWRTHRRAGGLAGAGLRRRRSWRVARPARRTRRRRATLVSRDGRLSEPPCADSTTRPDSRTHGVIERQREIDQLRAPKSMPPRKPRRWRGKRVGEAEALATRLQDARWATCVATPRRCRRGCMPSRSRCSSSIRHGRAMKSAVARSTGIWAKSPTPSRPSAIA